MRDIGREAPFPEQVDHPLFTFQHTLSGVNKSIDIIRREKSNAKKQVFFVPMSNGVELGHVSGLLKTTRGEREFFSNYARNYKYNTDDSFDKEQSVSNILGAMIVELVAKGYITTWFSSDDLSEAGIRMYEEHIGSDHRVVVAPANREGSLYMVTKLYAF